MPEIQSVPSKYLQAIVQITLALQLVFAQAHREHKVHNIVLYPDKHSWCKTQTIKQVISYPGCTSITIDNNVCVGACFSYSIPHTEPSDPGEVIVPYCDSCQPSETNWEHITLQCDKSDPDMPPQLIKHVQIIQNCSCTPCERDPYNRNKYDLDGQDEMMIPQNDVPDLLDALNNRNETTIIDAEHSNKVKELMDHKIITLLKNIQANNSQHDKEQLMDLLRIVQGPNHKASDKSIGEFVESMNAENIELDIPKLREILVKFEHSKYYKKHKNFDPVTGVGAISLGGGGVAIGPDITDEMDLAEVDSSQLTAVVESETGDLQTSDESAHAPPELIENSTRPSGGGGHHHGHHGHHHTPSSVVGNLHVHVASAIEPAPLVDDGEAPHTPSHTHGVHHHGHAHHGHHHVGEVVTGGHSHLARGPHGALVIEPDRIHEKLDVNPHELKPNHAGTLLSYHSHGADIEKPLD